MKTLTLPRQIFLWQIDKLLLVFTGSVLVPFMFHVIPVYGAQFLGSMWLPIFYAPLIAAILYRPHVALVPALLAPWVNWLLTGHPTLPMAQMLTFELVLFVAITTFFLNFYKHFWGAGLFAYGVTKMVSVTLLAELPVSSIGPALLHARMGLFVLAVIGWLAVDQKKKVTGKT